MNTQGQGEGEGNDDHRLAGFALKPRPGLCKISEDGPSEGFFLPPDLENEGTRKESEEEVDPLDAFMAEITQIQQVQEQEARQRPRTIEDGVDEDEDEDDGDVDAEYLLKARQRAGLALGSGFQAGGGIARDVDSDEEVYATARAVEKNMEVTSLRKDNIKFPPISVSRSRQEYEDLVKLSYCPPPELASLDGAALAARRRSLNIKINPDDVKQAPIQRFEQCGFEKPLLSAISDAGFCTPTPIQAQALPVVLSGRDVLGIAQTGSGKTAAFVLPMIVHVMTNRKFGGNSLLALVLAPTRELAEQIHKETRRFGRARPYGIKVVAAFGGLDKYQQIKELRGGAEIAVGTPGRVLDLSKEKACSLATVGYVVLDEADRMLDMGFEPQIRSILGQIRPDRQTVMFSATMPRKIQRLASDFLSSSRVQITVGTGVKANQDVKQSVIVMEDEEAKRRWLEANVSMFVDQGDVLIFVNRRDRVEELTSWLATSAGVRVAGLHGDMAQAERMQVLAGFGGEELSGKLHVVVATDIAARGLDIHSIKTVVNYDPPKDSDTYIHRVGRTGRAGDKEGNALTLLLPTERKAAADLIRCFEMADSNGPLDSRVYDIAGRTPHSRFHPRPSSRPITGGQPSNKGRHSVLDRGQGFVPASLSGEQESHTEVGKKPSVVVVMPKQPAAHTGSPGFPPFANPQASKEQEAIQRAREIAARLSGGGVKKARFT